MSKHAKHINAQSQSDNLLSMAGSYKHHDFSPLHMRHRDANGLDSDKLYLLGLGPVRKCVCVGILVEIGGDWRSHVGLPFVKHITLVPVSQGGGRPACGALGISLGAGAFLPLVDSDGRRPEHVRPYPVMVIGGGRGGFVWTYRYECRDGDIV